MTFATLSSSFIGKESWIVQIKGRPLRINLPFQHGSFSFRIGIDCQYRPNVKNKALSLGRHFIMDSEEVP
ncbi:hypothetical protein ASZ90_013048 [hydrocarbon metagenome]|uniref:Uncharacterized protein n=1 Tax=hydrocarbon metagenome TaxID=938273 RepID=A0A0W8F8U1_9ZZZZ